MVLIPTGHILESKGRGAVQQKKNKNFPQTYININFKPSLSKFRAF